MMLYSSHLENEGLHLGKNIAIAWQVKCEEFTITYNTYTTELINIIEIND